MVWEFSLHAFTIHGIGVVFHLEGLLHGDKHGILIRETSVQVPKVPAQHEFCTVKLILIGALELEVHLDQPATSRWHLKTREQVVTRVRLKYDDLICMMFLYWNPVLIEFPRCCWSSMSSTLWNSQSHVSGVSSAMHRTQCVHIEILVNHFATLTPRRVAYVGHR